MVSRVRNAAVADPYEGLTDAALADALGALEAACDGAKDRLDRARSVMVARGAFSLTGKRFVYVRSINPIERLDTKKLKSTYGIAWYAKWLKPGTRTCWTATRMADLPPPAAPPEPPPSGSSASRTTA